MESSGMKTFLNLYKRESVEAVFRARLYIVRLCKFVLSFQSMNVHWLSISICKTFWFEPAMNPMIYRQTGVRMIITYIP